MLTDENGLVSMPVQGMGDYNVKVTKQGFQETEMENEVSCPVDSSCEECRPTLSMSIPQDFCDNTVQLHVTVVNEQGNPINQANVNLILSSSAAGASSSNVGGELITNPEGKVSPYIYESGTYMITVDHAGFEPKSIQTVVTNTTCEDQEIPIVVTLHENGPVDSHSNSHVEQIGVSNQIGINIRTVECQVAAA